MAFPGDRVLQMNFLGQSVSTLPCHFLSVVSEVRARQQCLIQCFSTSSPTHADPPSFPLTLLLKPGQVSILHFCRELCFFLVWAGLRAKSIMSLPVSCFALTGDDCSVRWVSSLGPAPLLDRKPPLNLWNPPVVALHLLQWLRGLLLPSRRRGEMGERKSPTDQWAGTVSRGRGPIPAL